MNETYIGPNSKTEYAKTRIKTSICWIIYTILLNIPTFFILYLCIYFLFNASKHNLNNYMIFFAIGSFIFLFLFGILLTATITNICLIIKNNKEINYYNNNHLIYITEMLIPFDTKLWLTAPKDTFHPMSLKMEINGEIRSFKTAIIFTNSSTYFKLPKFKMPEILMSKNFIKGYAIVGYDPRLDEVVVIKLSGNID